MSPKDTEWGLVTEMVRDHFFISGEPRPKLVQFGFSPEFVSRIPLSYVSSDNSVALVEAVRNSGIETQLQLLSTLVRIDSLISLPAGKEAERLKCELEEAVRLHISPQDFFLSRVLSNGAEVFIDRVDFRKRLRQFFENPDKTVLVVDGEPDSGRSYSYKLIRHIGEHCNFRPVRVTLNRTSTAEQVVQRLTESVADPNATLSPLNPTQLNDPLPEIDAALHRVVRQATTARGQYWLVLDDCDKLDVNSDVWDCIGKLALTIYNQRPAPPDVPPRLVLLGYSPTMRQLPYEIRKNEVRDTARMFGPDDLQEFFRQFFTEASTPPDTKRIASLVETTVPAVLHAGEASGPDSYMRKVCTAAAESVRLYGALVPGEDFGTRLSERLHAAAAAPGPADVSDPRKAYREAASLLGRFDPARLKLPGEEEPSGAAGLELLRDCRAVGARNTFSWVLKPEARDTALRGFADPEAAHLALLANLEQIPPGSGPESTALAYLDGTPPDLAHQKLDELPHTLQAVLWLAQIPGITGIPQSGEVQQLLDRARLMQPLERLARSSFQGRVEELARLRAYIGLPTPFQDEFTRALGSGTKRPVLIHGLSGVGKSALLTTFLRDSLRDFPTPFPFAYVDFARPTLSVHEPATLIAEMARQLRVQFPEHHADFDALAHACEETVGLHRAEEDTVDELYELATTRATMARLSQSGVHALSAAREGMLAAQLATLVVQAVGVPAAQQPPLVLVIDSFEEAQYRGSPELGRMWGIWSALQKVHPRLRTVVAGRLLKEHPARLVEPLTIELNELGPEASAALLTCCGVTDERLAEKLADRVGGNPLSLKLAARAAEQEGDPAESLNELIESLPRRRRHFFRKVDQMLIQGILYERILRRIGEEDVRALAQAGMALRTITPGLIREVLAEPCGLTVDSDLEAERLFGLFSRLDLVESAAPGSVRHRTDLRAIMLRLADRARPDLMRAVGQRAVAYYAACEGLEPRAEEIYHRLRLNESPREVELRWLPGVERFLVGADEDMAGRSAAYLAGRFGGHTPDEVMAKADQEDWERITAHEVEDLLSQGYTDEAAARLEGRRPWTSGSPLHPLWVETLDRLGRRTDARAAADAAVDRAEEDGFPGLQLELLLLSARLAEADGDRGEADDDLAEAEEIATGLGKDFEALGALLTRAQLASGAEEHDQEVEGRLAERLRRLPDAELVRQPALVRAAVAEVSRDHPRILEHALDVVGLPETEDGVLDILGEAITRVVAGRPELRASLRRLLEDSASPPDRRFTTGATDQGVQGMLREARRLGTLDGLARRLLALDDRSGELVSGVAAVMGAGATTPGRDVPTDARPVASEPGASEPVASEPGASEPGASEPGDADPSAESPAEGNGHRAA
ncbi:ATP-binding protein [Streptomyces sp. ISL-43]|uniref:AAA family ATPase n=1 Tax=Streptomyces sp. ISL-43 TaxID=2819183 RepID=UPI001BED2F41|nr:ATP-binding protein [Streptomyces sp. ISL-43]MBT2447447.1 ATP-binding protein [Streptomyces sp. ISL-43]